MLKFGPTPQKQNGLIKFFGAEDALGSRVRLEGIATIMLPKLFGERTILAKVRGSLTARA